MGGVFSAGLVQRRCRTPLFHHAAGGVLTGAVLGGGLCSVPRGAASGDAVASDPAVRPIRMVEEHHEPDFFRPVHSGAAATMGWNCSPLYPRRPVIRHPDAPVVGRICDKSCVACGDRDGLQYRCGLLRRQKTRQGPKSPSGRRGIYDGCQNITKHAKTGEPLDGIHRFLHNG